MKCSTTIDPGRTRCSTVAAIWASLTQPAHESGDQTTWPRICAPESGQRGPNALGRRHARRGAMHVPQVRPFRPGPRASGTTAARTCAEGDGRRGTSASVCQPTTRRRAPARTQQRRRCTAFPPERVKRGKRARDPPPQEVPDPQSTSMSRRAQIVQQTHPTHAPASSKIRVVTQLLRAVDPSLDRVEGDRQARAIYLVM